MAMRVRSSCGRHKLCPSALLAVLAGAIELITLAAVVFNPIVTAGRASGAADGDVKRLAKMIRRMVHFADLTFSGPGKCSHAVTNKIIADLEDAGPGGAGLLGAMYLYRHTHFTGKQSDAAKTSPNNDLMRGQRC